MNEACFSRFDRKLGNEEGLQLQATDRCQEKLNAS